MDDELGRATGEVEGVGRGAFHGTIRLLGALATEDYCCMVDEVARGYVFQSYEAECIGSRNSIRDA